MPLIRLLSAGCVGAHGLDCELWFDWVVVVGPPGMSDSLFKQNRNQFVVWEFSGPATPPAYADGFAAFILGKFFDRGFHHVVPARPVTATACPDHAELVILLNVQAGHDCGPYPPLSGRGPYHRLVGRDPKQLFTP